MVDYVKRPSTPAPSGQSGVSLSKVTLTKSAPSVSARAVLPSQADDPIAGPARLPSNSIERARLLVNEYAAPATVPQPVARS